MTVSCKSNNKNKDNNININNITFCVMFLLQVSGASITV